MVQANTVTNSPYPSAKVQWWNVLNFGVENRVTQIASQAYIGYTGNNELWIRSRHDLNW